MRTALSHDAAIPGALAASSALGVRSWKTGRRKARGRKPESRKAKSRKPRSQKTGGPAQKPESQKPEAGKLVAGKLEDDWICRRWGEGKEGGTGKKTCVCDLSRRWPEARRIYLYVHIFKSIYKVVIYLNITKYIYVY